MAAHARKRRERRLEQFRSRTRRGEHPKGLDKRFPSQHLLLAVPLLRHRPGSFADRRETEPSKVFIIVNRA